MDVWPRLKPALIRVYLLSVDLLTQERYRNGYNDGAKKAEQVSAVLTDRSISRFTTLRFRMRRIAMRRVKMSRFTTYRVTGCRVGRMHSGISGNAWSDPTRRSVIFANKVSFLSFVSEQKSTGFNHHNMKALKN